MSASAPSFPGSRELAGLWRQLGSPATDACWICRLLLHCVEAPVLVRTPAPRAPFEMAVVRALAAAQPAAASELARRLGLVPALVGRVAGKLLTEGLIEAVGADGWRLTRIGSLLAEGQGSSGTHFQRDLFCFVQHPTGALRYLRLSQSGVPLSDAPAGWSFAPQLLADCVRQPTTWKARHHFPTEIVGIVTPQEEFPSSTADVPAWQRVILDRAEQLTVALVVQREAVRGYVAEPEQWKLLSSEPVFVLSERLAVEEAFGDLLSEPDTESWHAAWKEWCASHGIPLAEAAGIRLVRRGVALQVFGHPLRPERLRALAADPAQPEPWLLAGTGPYRCAARLEFASPRGGR